MKWSTSQVKQFLLRIMRQQREAQPREKKGAAELKGWDVVIPFPLDRIAPLPKRTK